MVTAAPSVKLSASDVDTFDSVDLMQQTWPTFCFVERAGLEITYADASGSGSASTDDRTIVTLKLVLQAPTADGVWNLFRQVEQKLQQARRGAGPIPVGAPVCLRLQMAGASEPVYFDLADTPDKRSSIVRDAATDAGARTLRCLLTLVCLPYPHGAPIDYPVSATLTCGLGSTLFLPDVPGDLPALATVTITDVSTSTAVINGVHLGRRSLWGMQSGDCTPILATTATFSGSAGTNFSDATGMNGTTVARLAAATSTFQPFAQAVSPGGAFDSYPAADLIAMVRDSTGGGAGIGKPTNVVVGSTTGSGYTGPWLIQVTEIDGSGNESAASDPVAVNGVTGGLAVSWTVAGTPTNHRVYGIQVGGPNPGTGTWHYWATGSAAGSYIITGALGTAIASPPGAAAAALVGCVVRANVGLSATSPSFLSGRGVPTRLQSSQWEPLNLGSFPFPPLPTAQGQSALPWTVRLEGRVVGSGSPALDCAGFWLFPSYDEPQLVSSYNGLLLATKRVWVHDTRRDLRTGVVLRSTADNSVQGQASVQGRFTLGPGNNLLIIAPIIAGGQLDTVNTKYTVQVTVRPRYKFMTGAV